MRVFVALLIAQLNDVLRAVLEEGAAVIVDHASGDQRSLYNDSDTPVGSALSSEVVVHVAPGETFLTTLPPSADAGGTYSAAEGGTITLSATGVDPEGSPLAFAWDLDDDGVFESPGQTVAFSAEGLDGPSSVLATVEVSDGVLPVTDTATVQIVNVAPVVQSVTGPEEPVAVGTPVPNRHHRTDRRSVKGCPVPGRGNGVELARGLPMDTAQFTDPAGAADNPFICTVDFGDDTGVQSGVIVDSACVADPHEYVEPGIYTVAITVTDKDGGTSLEAMSPLVVVHDPTAGHVTGGGWIESPAGAHASDPLASGRANFGFVAKYKKGANVPHGNTEFHFTSTSLNFHSDVHEWLLITGGSNARFKGTGTINGDGPYKFMIWAGGDSPDTFRIKIWSEIDENEIVVYDNGVEQEISAGNIVVHTSK